MKKLVIIASAVLFLGSFLSSCRSHGTCAGITTQVEKVKVSSERPL